MIKIIDFTEEHIEQAFIIARANYDNERNSVNILPEINEIPDFMPLVKNNLGVSAFDGEKMAGYLCCFGPFKNAFGTTNDIGVWSPLHGNGLLDYAHKSVYAKMYQEAAKKWVSLNINNHAITFYAHNNFIHNQLYRYGFGLRCIDAIRTMNEIEAKNRVNFTFSELEYSNFELILPLDKQLRNHLKESPMFLRYEQGDEEENNQKRRVYGKNVRYFIAGNDIEIIAYIKISSEGENFVSEVNSVKNICGAYCLPEHRGKGIIQNLLNYVIKKLQAENYRLLGVDFESFNPTASGFWLKYFTEYTHSVVRRIDDRFLKGYYCPSAPVTEGL